MHARIGAPQRTLRITSGRYYSCDVTERGMEHHDDALTKCAQTRHERPANHAKPTGPPSHTILQPSPTGPVDHLQNVLRSGAPRARRARTIRSPQYGQWWAITTNVSRACICVLLTWALDGTHARCVPPSAAPKRVILPSTLPRRHPMMMSHQHNSANALCCDASI